MDEQLIESVRRRRFANPQHLAELLNRTDISPDIMQQVRVNLSYALNSDKFSQDDLQRVISQLNSANSSNRFDEVLAELRYPNRLIRAGEVYVKNLTKLPNSLEICNDGLPRHRLIEK